MTASSACILRNSGYNAYARKRRPRMQRSGRPTITRSLQRAWGHERQSGPALHKLSGAGVVAKSVNPGMRMNIRFLKVRWEAIALLPASLVLAPLLVYGTIGLLFATVGIAVSQNLSGAKAVALGLVVQIAAQSVLGFGGLICLWVLALGGMATIPRLSFRRWALAAFLAAGECDATSFLLGRHVLREVMADLRSIFLWSLILGLPMLLGLKYLVLLLRPGFGGAGK